MSNVIHLISNTLKNSNVENVEKTGEKFYVSDLIIVPGRDRLGI